MTTRTKKKRAARVPSTPKPWPPSVIAQAFDLHAESWMREPEPLADPEASEELKRHRLGVVHAYARARAKFAGGRTGGKDRERAALARDTAKALRAKHPRGTAKELRAKAVESDPRLGEVLPDGGRWENIVSEFAPRKRKKRAT